MDKIDERDKKEKMKKSLVKYWNVAFEETGAQDQQEEGPSEEAKDEAMRRAEEIFQRLQAEEEENERKKQEEIEALLRQQTAALEDDVKEDLYNETTRSYSGAYGQGQQLDDEHADQVHRILNAKADKIQEMLNEAEKGRES